jgi:N-acetylneuraminic acid mutarotase
MGTVVGDVLFVMGGFISEDLDTTLRVHRYDLRTRQWDEATALPVASEHSGLALVGDRIILTGGLDPITDTVWSYDVAADTYAALPSLPAPTSAMALMLYDGVLHSIAGLGPDGETDVNAHYTLELDVDSAWSIVSGAIPNLRNHLGGAVIGDRLYIVGGRHGWDESAGNQPTLSIFNPADGKWKDGAPLPLARSEIAGATFEMKGKLIVVGGAVNPAKPSAQVFVYDPASDEWGELPELPGARKGAVAAAWGDRIVVSTGSPTGIDPSGTTWVGCCL